MSKVPKKQKTSNTILNIKKRIDSADVFGEIRDFLSQANKARNELLTGADGENPTYEELNWDQRRLLGHLNMAIHDAERKVEKINEEHLKVVGWWQGWTDEERAQKIIDAESTLKSWIARLEKKRKKPGTDISILACPWRMEAHLIGSKHYLAVLRELKASSVAKTVAYLDKDGFTKQVVKPVIPSLHRATLAIYLSNSRQ